MEVDEEEQALVVDPPQSWDPSLALLGGNQSMDIIHAEADKIWVQSMPLDLVGKPVRQDKYMGQLTDMFHEFGQEWSKRWDRHADVDPTFWDPVVDFVRSAFPLQEPMECPPITYDMWIAALKRKSKRAAVGPDGISRMDLLQLPRSLTEQLLNLLAEVEAGGSWPSQMLQGFIIALEKVENACAVQQYRPICIFSLCYRTWSSIRARQVIQHLAKQAPTSCAGSLPNKSAVDIWYTILSSIEMAHHTQEELSGAVIDLIKCFNMLPRYPIMAMMQHFGVAEPILRGWAAAQVNMKRRFKLRSCIGPALGSVTGFAEGCALSVTGMIAVNITAHRWLSIKHPSSTLFSYVDNLETVSPSAPEAIESLCDLMKFTDLMDVQVDAGKTYLWSSQSTGRKHFREQQEGQAYTVLYWARDLGGHMTYSKQHTNRTLVQRLEQMLSLWNLLSRSLSPYTQKLRALKAKAWPLALHGANAAMLADNHFVTLRTGAVRGLREHSSGMNPMLHLSAVEHPMHDDPQFFVLVDTVLTFRAHGPDVDALDFILDAHRAPFASKQMPPGPCFVLLSRLHQLGWSWVSRGLFVDHADLPINVLTCPVQELKQRLLEAWQHRVLGMVQQRKTFQGAPFMHPGITTARMHMLPPESQALLRTTLNGTFFTADRLAKRDPTASSKCRFCQEEDSQTHRHWLCPFFASCRSHLSEEQIRLILELPPVVPNHAWLPEPPNLRLFRKACLEIPDESQEFAWPSNFEDHLHLFTDGSCLAPTNMACKLASWGVVVGQTSDLQFVPVSNGLLHGWCQTAARAEIVAATSACLFALKVNRPCTIWVDNDRVFNKLQRFKQGKCRIGVNQKDADLWGKLAFYVSRLGPLLQSVGKVVSHQDVSGALDEAEEWIYKGNAAADATAANAYARFPQLMCLWQQLCKDFSDVCTLREHLHKVVIAVAQKSFQQPAMEHLQTEDPEEAPITAQPRVCRDQVVAFQPTPVTSAWTSRRFAIDRMQEIVRWFEQLIDRTEPIRMMSWFQLNALFEHQNDFVISYKPSSKRYFLNSTQQRTDFVKRANSFSRWVQGVFTESCRVLHVRPCSSCIKFWTMCLPIQIKPVCFETADVLLSQHQPTYAQVRDLRHIWWALRETRPLRKCAEGARQDGKSEQKKWWLTLWLLVLGGEAANPK